MRFSYLICNCTLFLFVLLPSWSFVFESRFCIWEEMFNISSFFSQLPSLVSALPFDFFSHLIPTLILPYFLSLVAYRREHYVIFVILNLTCLVSKDRYTPEVKGSFYPEFRNWIWWAFRHSNVGATMRVRFNSGAQPWPLWLTLIGTWTRHL